MMTYEMYVHYYPTKNAFIHVMVIGSRRANNKFIIERDEIFSTSTFASIHDLTNKIESIRKEFNIPKEKISIRYYSEAAND